jgi:hypothetical protein
MNKENSNQAGKGDAPRNCFSQEYRKNYDHINWKKDKPKDEKILDNTDITTNK